MEYDQCWRLINRFFLYRDRLKNWDSWRERYRGRLVSRAQADDAIAAMIASLDDDYTFYRDVSETAKNELVSRDSHPTSFKMLKHKIGYIRVSTFNAVRCVDETKTALSRLASANAYILDLRGNSGGSVKNALEVFSLLASSGEFVSTVGVSDGNPDCERVILNKTNIVTFANGQCTSSNRRTNLCGNKPIIVLVDRSTKSAAEMLAGALRDDGRATLLGARTYGKGIVQRVWAFEAGGSIKITAAKYYLPGGSNIHGKGLTPNAVVQSSSSEFVVREAVSRLTLKRLNLTKKRS